MPTPNAIRVTVQQDLLGGEKSTNVWATDKSGLGTPLTLAEGQDIADAFASFYTALSTAATPNRGIHDLRPDHATLSRITVHDLEDNVKFEYSYSSQGTGSECIPYQVAAVVSLISATASRKGRGRVYVGPWSAAAVEMDFVSGAAPQLEVAAQTALLNATADLEDRLAALVPPRHLQMLSPTDNVVRQITTARVDTVLDTQRRRRSDIGGVTASIAL